MSCRYGAGIGWGICWGWGGAEAAGGGATGIVVADVAADSDGYVITGNVDVEAWGVIS